MFRYCFGVFRSFVFEMVVMLLWDVIVSVKFKLRGVVLKFRFDWKFIGCVILGN